MKKTLFLAFAVALSIPVCAHAFINDAVQKDGFGLDLTYPSVHIEKAPHVQKTINSDILTFADRMKQEYGAPEEEREAYLDYSTTYINADVISVILDTYFSAPGDANGDSHSYGLVWNGNTGERMLLSDFVDIPTRRDFLAKLEDGTYRLRKTDGEDASFDETFAPDDLFSNFCVNDNKTVSLIYERGTFGPRCDGTLFIDIPMKKGLTLAPNRAGMCNDETPVVTGENDSSEKISASADKQ